MTARKLHPQEYWRADLNMAVAFETPFDFQKEQEKSQTDKPKEAGQNEDYYGTFLEEDQPPVASLIMNKKQVRFDGHTVKMGGVGGVATLPAHRRGGAIRAMMRLALRDLYNDGYALSHLYPFSTAYYRQYGFAPAGQSVLWRVKLADLKGLPQVGGSVRQLLPGDDLSPLLEVYNGMYGDINFSCLRKVFDKDLEGGKPLSAKRWVFLWRDEGGVPGGLLVGSRSGETLHCSPTFPSVDAFLFTSPRALMGLLNFVHTAFIANFREIQFTLPPHMDLCALLPELSDMNCKHILNGMSRAVNAECLLSLCQCKGAGEVRLRVTDDIIEENNAVFSLGFAPGEANRVERVSAEPDLTLDVGNLAVLLGGARDAGSLEWTPDIVVHRWDPVFERVFYRKPCHVLDLF